MPDIAMCAETTCPRRESCLRYLLPPDRYMQSYAERDPATCDDYWHDHSRYRLRSVVDADADNRRGES